MYKSFAKKVLFVSFLIFLVLVIAAYLMDPLFVYRYHDGGDYWIQPEQTSAGLIKTYDYDTVLLGSSVTQNINAKTFGDAVGGKVLKVNSGGMSIKEIEGYVKWIQDVGKAKRIYICLDLPQFGKDKSTELDRLKYHIMDNNPLNDYKYLLGFETWMRFIPIDTGLMLLKAAGVQYPERIKLKTDIDRAGEWAGDFIYSEKQVKNDYIKGVNRVTSLDPENLYSRMTERVDDFLSHFEFGETEFVFYFAPYSALCWSDMQSARYLEDVMNAKIYIEEQLLLKDNVTVVDFQAMDEINDLNCYRDVSHFGPMVSDKMIEMFRDGTYVVSNLDEGREILNKQTLLVEQFREENKDWIELGE